MENGHEKDSSHEPSKGEMWLAMDQEEGNAVDREGVVVLPGALALRVIGLNADDGSSCMLCPAARGAAGTIALRACQVNLFHGGLRGRQQSSEAGEVGFLQANQRKLPTNDSEQA
eukprot:607931-Pelagomonas_calceolata.AAC.4